MNLKCRAEISKRVGVSQKDDNGAMMPQRLIYATRDLRNAIAHNDVVFDARFRTGKIHGQVGNTISNATGVKNLTFDTITDYIVLIVYQQKLLGVPKTEMKKLLIDYTEYVEQLRERIPTNVFNQIIYPDNKKKINRLREYISS